MIFEQWQATRKDRDALSEEEAGAYEGQPGAAYDGGFILTTGVMGFTVPICNTEAEFATLQEAEAYLWREWIVPEIIGEGEG